MTQSVSIEITVDPVSVELSPQAGSSIEVALAPIGLSAAEAQASQDAANDAKNYRDTTLAARDTTTAARDTAVSAKDTAESAASTATTQAGAASNSASAASQSEQQAAQHLSGVEDYANQLGTVSDTTAAGNVALAADDETYQFIDPDGADRDVTLPSLTADDAAQGFTVNNTATAGPYVLRVKNSGGAQIGPDIPYGYTLAVIWTGSQWRAL